MFATQNTKIFTRKWKLILKCFAHIHCVDQIFWQLSRQLELANFKINAPYCEVLSVASPHLGGEA
jgi:hypothetical protein